MAKTTTKKPKSSKKRTKRSTKKTTSQATSRRSVSKKKTVARKTARKSVAKKAPTKSATPTLNAFFADKKNVVKVLIILVILGAVYLFRNVLVVAAVNGRPIWRWEVVQRLEEQGGRQVLDSIITEKVVKQAVRQSGVTVEQEETDAALAEIEARLTAQGQTLEQALEDQGMTQAELIEDIVLQRSVEKAVASEIAITDEEVDAYIAENAELLPEGVDPEVLREDVRQQLQSLAVNEEILKWVQDLQDNARIMYFREYQRAGF